MAYFDLIEHPFVDCQRQLLIVVKAQEVVDQKEFSFMPLDFGQTD